MQALLGLPIAIQALWLAHWTFKGIANEFLRDGCTIAVLGFPPGSHPNAPAANARRVGMMKLFSLFFFWNPF